MAVIPMPLPFPGQEAKRAGRAAAQRCVELLRGVQPLDSRDDGHGQIGEADHQAEQQGLDGQRGGHGSGRRLRFVGVPRGVGRRRTIDVVVADHVPLASGELDQFPSHSGGDRLPLFVQRHVALTHPQGASKFGLSDAQAVAKRFERVHAAIISRTDRLCQQPDCLPRMSFTNTVVPMPAKPLTDEQRADAARLKLAFKAWQQRQKDLGAPVSQEAAAEKLGFGQSALSQYLNGVIPLNADVLQKFCFLVGGSPKDISPTIYQDALDKSFRWVNVKTGEKSTIAQKVSRREEPPLSKFERDLVDAFRNLPEDEQQNFVMQVLRRSEYFKQQVEKHVQKVLEARGVKSFNPPSDAKVERHLGLPGDRRHGEDRRHENIPVDVDRRRSDRRAYHSPTAETYYIDQMPEERAKYRREGDK